MNYKLKVDESLALNINEYIVPDMVAIIICVHGMAEHSGRYLGFVKFLNNNKYSVITYDHRGHGMSLLKEEDKGYLGKDGFNKMVTDLHLVVTTVKEKFPKSQIFLLGHSMGSFVVQRYIQMFNTVDGVILSGSNYGTKQLRLGIILSKIACLIKGEKTKGKLINKLSFGAFNRAFKPNRTDFDWLTRDEKVVDEYINDDLCGFICSNRFYLDFFKGLIKLSKRKNIAKINPNLQVFIISGDKDPVGHKGKGVIRLYHVYKKYIKDVELKLYKDSRHEILNELNKTEVYQDILNWLER